MVIVIQHFNPLIAGQRDDLCAKLPERLMHRRFNSCKLRLCFFKVFSLNSNGKIALLLNPLPALMDLLLHDIIVNTAETVIAVILPL